MTSNNVLRFAIVIALITLCVPAAAQIREIDTPAKPGSGQPHLFTAPDGSVILSWLERAGGDSAAYRLKMARRVKGKWSAPNTIVESNNISANWANFPSVVAGDNNHLFAHWLEKSGGNAHAADVRFSSSSDGGKTWIKPITVHSDGTKTEHGFVSMVPRGDSAALIWLDGRKTKPGHEGHGDMALRYAEIDARGVISDEAEIDARACECCQTDMVWSGETPVIAFRDRAEDETRDNYVIRRTAKGWTRPAAIHNDGWKIEGCPVNGPRLDASGSNVAAAWFSGARMKNRVMAAFSSDGGSTFGNPVVIDAGKPLGRVDVAMLSDGSAVVSWMEQVGKAAEVRARRVRPDGTMDPFLKVAASSPARSAGIPRMTLAGKELYLTWTEMGDPSRVRVAVLPVK